MKIKRSIFKIVLLLIPMLFIVGYSAWIIVYEFSITPEYIENSISKYYGVSQETTYNGEKQVPLTNPVDIFSDTTRYRIEYYYKNTTDLNYPDNECQPVESGIYDIKIIVYDNDVSLGTCQVKFTIKPKVIRLKNEIIELDYSTNYNSFAAMENYLKNDSINKIIFTNEDKSNLDTDEIIYYSITSISNGYRTYLPLQSDVIIGSTYSCKIQLSELSSNNYILDKDFVIVKFKSVYTNGDYYTIEDAILNQSVQMVLKGDSTSNTSYVTTEFCGLTLQQGYPYTNYKTSSHSNYTGKDEYLNKKIFEIKESIKFLIPINSDSDDFLTSETEFNSGKVYSALIIPNDIALVFKEKSTLQIAGQIGVLGSIGIHGVILNNGLISMETNSYLYSYGFLKGTGEVIFKSGSVTYDIMRIYDWCGGSNAIKFLNNAFPVTSWTMHNISCKMKIYNGAEMRGYSTLNITGAGYQKPEFGVIGKDYSTGNCLFKPNNNSKNTDYVLKYFNPINDDVNISITSYNQIKGQRDIIELYGSYIDGQLSLSMKADLPIVGVQVQTFSTSKSISVPISYLDIIICENSTLNLANSSYVFTLGTSLTVAKNATLNLADNVYLAFDRMTEVGNPSSATIAPYFATDYCQENYVKNAILFISGILSGTGSICGEISAEDEEVLLAVGKYNVEKINFKSEFGNYRSVSNLPTYGYISDGTTISFTTFSTESSKSYISTGTKDNYFFVEQAGVKEIILNFYFSNDTTVDPIVIKKILILKVYTYVDGDDPSLKQYDGKFIYIFNGNECQIDVPYYEFNNWYFISNNKPIKNSIIIFDEADSNNNIYNIYGDFSKINYNINYYFGLINEDGTSESITDGVLFEDKMSSFNLDNFISISGKKYLQISTRCSFLEKDSIYWYICNPNTLEKLIDDPFVNISEDILNNYFNLFGQESSLCLYCEFLDYEKYTIKFENYDLDPIGGVSDGADILLPQTPLVNNSSYPMYIGGWYLDADTSNQLYGTPGQIKIFNELTLKQYADENNVITLYAKSIKKDFQANYYNEGDENDSNKIFKSQYFNSGQEITILDNLDENGNPISKIDEPEDGYFVRKKFIGWSLNPYDENAEILYYPDKIKLDGNVDFIAYYEDIEYCKLTITITPSGNTDHPNPSSVSVSYYNIDNKKVDTTTKNDNEIEFKRNTEVTLKVTSSDDGFKNKGTVAISFISDDPDFNFNDKSITADNSDSYTHGTFESSSNITVTTTYNIGNDGSCIPSSTIITLADGSKKKVEDLTLDDMLLVFNHETGMFEASPIVFIDDDGWKEYDIVNLKFSNGTITRLIYEHGYFDVTLNNYVYVDEYNYRDFIGHQFVYTNGDKLENVTLVDSYITTEYVGCYSPVTAVHLNYIVDGMLSMPGGIEGIFNIFEYGDNLMFDEELMKSDIEKYGIMEYEVLAPYVPYEMYIAFNAKYFNVAIGKGYITFDEILYYAEKYLDRHGLRE